MKIAGIYSFTRGKEIIEAEFKCELREVEQIIAAIDSHAHKTNWDLEHRGVADIDISVLIFGVTK